MPPTSLMWPGQDIATPWAVPPKCDGTCFTHLNGVSIAHAHSAAKCGNVRVGSPERIPEKLVLDRHGNAIEGGELVRRAVEHAFGARAVVAADVDDQGVVEFAEVFDGLDDPTDLMVGVGEVGPIDVRLLDEELLLLPTERIPLRQFLRPRRQLGVRGHDAQALLVGEDGLAHFVPALVEEVHVADLLDPLGRGMMRRMGGARHVIDEPRLAGSDLLELLHVLDGLIGHRRLQVPAGIALGMGRWPSYCGTGSAATGWRRHRRSRRNNRSPCRWAID